MLARPRRIGSTIPAGLQLICNRFAVPTHTRADVDQRYARSRPGEPRCLLNVCMGRVSGAPVQASSTVSAAAWRTSAGSVRFTIRLATTRGIGRRPGRRLLVCMPQVPAARAATIRSRERAERGPDVGSTTGRTGVTARRSHPSRGCKGDSGARQGRTMFCETRLNKKNALRSCGVVAI